MSLVNRNGIRKNNNNIQKRDVLKRTIQRLFSHPLNKEIRFDVSSKSFKVIVKKGNKECEIKVPGLTKPLKKIFWPNYKYTTPLHNQGTGVKSGYEGRNRGNQVHEELEYYFNQGTKQLLQRYKILELHPFTRRIIYNLKHKYKLKPLRSEFMIYDEDLKVATKIDMLCTDENNNLVAIELKTGMNSYFLRGNDKMKGPLTNVLNSPFNQASLQILLASLILSAKYQVEITDIRILKVFMSEGDVCETVLYPLEKEIVERKYEIYDYFKQWNS